MPRQRLPTNRCVSGDGPVRVISTAADQMFHDIKPEMTGEDAGLQGRPGTDQSLGRIADFGGLSQALEPQERNPGGCGGEGVRGGGMDGRPRLIRSSD